MEYLADPRLRSNTLKTFEHSPDAVVRGLPRAGLVAGCCSMFVDQRMPLTVFPIRLMLSARRARRGTFFVISKFMSPNNGITYYSVAFDGTS